MAASTDTTTPPTAGLFPPEATLREKDPATAASRRLRGRRTDHLAGHFDGDHVQVNDQPPTSPPTWPRCLASSPGSFPRYGQYTRGGDHPRLPLPAGARSRRPGRETYPAPYGPIDLRDRSDADAVFRKLLAYVEVPWARRWLMWSAVTWATVITVAAHDHHAARSGAPATWRRDVKPALFLAVVVVAVVIGDIFALQRELAVVGEHRRDRDRLVRRAGRGADARRLHGVAPLARPRACSSPACVVFTVPLRWACCSPAVLVGLVLLASTSSSRTSRSTQGIREVLPPRRSAPRSGACRRPPAGRASQAGPAGHGGSAVSRQRR